MPNIKTQTENRQALIVVGFLVAAVLIIVIPQLFMFRALAFVCLIGAIAAMIYPVLKKAFRSE